jgi:hypothetical protein
MTSQGVSGATSSSGIVLSTRSGAVVVCTLQCCHDEGLGLDRPAGEAPMELALREKHMSI